MQWVVGSPQLSEKECDVFSWTYHNYPVLGTHDEWIWPKIILALYSIQLKPLEERHFSLSLEYTLPKNTKWPHNGASSSHQHRLVVPISCGKLWCCVVVGAKQGKGQRTEQTKLLEKESVLTHFEQFLVVFFINPLVDLSHDRVAGQTRSPNKR